MRIHILDMVVYDRTMGGRKERKTDRNNDTDKEKDKITLIT